MEFISILQISI